MLSIQNLNYNYPDFNKKVIESLDFSVEKGEVINVIGKSGSGKSTLLKLIYGLLDFDQGEILYNNKKLRGPAYNLIPGNEMMKYVAQDYDILDFVTVGENVGKFLSNFDLGLKQKNIDEALAVVELEDFKDIYPNKLSGGQKQRVSIARALSQKPEILLLDEPFSNLDQMLKLSIREKIMDWSKKYQTTIIVTTHDLNDAFYTSEKILVLENGKMLQFDYIENVRKFPRSEYVSRLFGYVNILSVEQVAQFDILSKQKIVIYPEEILISSTGKFDAKVLGIMFQGRDYLIRFSFKGIELISFYSRKLILGELIRFNIGKYYEI